MNGWVAGLRKRGREGEKGRERLIWICSKNKQRETFIGTQKKVIEGGKK